MSEQINTNIETLQDLNPKIALLIQDIYNMSDERIKKVNSVLDVIDNKITLVNNEIQAMYDNINYIQKEIDGYSDKKDDDGNYINPPDYLYTQKNDINAKITTAETTVVNCEKIKREFQNSILPYTKTVDTSIENCNNTKSFAQQYINKYIEIVKKIQLSNGVQAPVSEKIFKSKYGNSGVSSLTGSYSSPDFNGIVTDIKGYKTVSTKQKNSKTGAKYIKKRVFRIKSLDNVKNIRFYKRHPISHGNWSGIIGNSMWCPDRNYKPLPKRPKMNNQNIEVGYNNPNNLTWGEILDKYKIKGIEFVNNEPVFDTVSRETLEIENYTDDRSKNFDKADIECAIKRKCTPSEIKKWRIDNGYTWHEKSDKRTMQKVPHEIHANIFHSGGISKYKKSVYKRK